MSEIFSTIRLMAILAVVLLLGFGVLLALPHSRLKEIVQPILGWTITVLSVGLILSPIDPIPDVIPIIGWADDVVALVVAIASAKAAMDTGKGVKQLH